jgi:hypothetical protein
MRVGVDKPIEDKSTYSTLQLNVKKRIVLILRYDANFE